MKSNNAVRFVASIGCCTDNPVVQRFLDRHDKRDVAAVNRLRVWSSYDLLTGDWVESPDSGRKGVYTRRECEKRVAKLNAMDKGRYVQLPDGYVRHENNRQWAAWEKWKKKAAGRVIRRDLVAVV